RTDHPTAETIYMNIREDNPHISLATVYRNLALLTESGEVQKISTGNGPDRFDGNAAPHNHFLCSCCGNVIDLDMDSISYVDEVAGKTFSGKVQGHKILFYGLCPGCLRSSNANSS
ncbi:MAG: transcriptional repressor, partial [Clostridiales bacterium]|nr:transcriptional repressor [Clostridiales bacterium]